MKLPLLLAGLLLCVPAAPAASNSIVKTVNGNPILKSQVDELMRARMFEIRRNITTQAELQTELRKLRETVTEMLVDQELILKEFEPLEATFGTRIAASISQQLPQTLY